MNNTIYITLSRQTSLQRQLDIIAHNLANVETTAYKAERPVFAEFLRRTKKGNDVSFVQDLSTVRDDSEGPFVRTGNPLDVAIHGDGYLVVQKANGDERYTRNGHFEINVDGNLVTSAGDLVLDVDSRPIKIPLGQTNVTITPDGSISGAIGPIARLQLVSFEHPQALKREANSLYSTPQDPQETRDVTVRQAMLEQSNVQPVLALTGMIDVLRSFQSNGRLVDTEDQLQRRTIDRIMRA